MSALVRPAIVASESLDRVKALCFCLAPCVFPLNPSRNTYELSDGFPGVILTHCLSPLVRLLERFRLGSFRRGHPYPHS
jgi:hypothetical protein